jgi:hypothetical protein
LSSPGRNSLVDNLRVAQGSLSRNQAAGSSEIFRPERPFIMPISGSVKSMSDAPRGVFVLLLLHKVYPCLTPIQHQRQARLKSSPTFSSCSSTVPILTPRTRMRRLSLRLLTGPSVLGNDARGELTGLVVAP